MGLLCGAVVGAEGREQSATTDTTPRQTHMTLAGAGYRQALGGFVLFLDIVLCVCGHACLVWRGHLQPLKAWNPTLLHTTLLHFWPGVFWVPVRELWGAALGFTIHCDGLVWLITMTGIAYAVPVVVVG